MTPGARFEPALGEFILPYDDGPGGARIPTRCCSISSPTTYAAAADAGDWDRAALECPLGVPGRPRPV